jgi:hypothetical protein
MDHWMDSPKDVAWPNMTTVEVAEIAIKRASVYAYVAAGTNVLLAMLAWFNVLQFISPWLFSGAIPFAIAGFFISRRSRTAALVGLVLYLVEVIAILSRAFSSIRGESLWFVVFTLFFINGVRGTFSLARLRSQCPPENV